MNCAQISLLLPSHFHRKSKSVYSRNNTYDTAPNVKLKSLELIYYILIIYYFMFFCRNASEECEECGDYVRLVFLLLPGSLAAVSLLIVLMFQASHKPSERKGKVNIC